MSWANRYHWVALYDVFKSDVSAAEAAAVLYSTREIQIFKQLKIERIDAVDFDDENFIYSISIYTNGTYL